MPESNPLPITAIIVTKNEEQRIEACLTALKNFDEILVIDSNSADQTTTIAKKHGAKTIPFTWNGKYPKKRGWILDNIPTQNDWVLFIDADEIMTQDLEEELQALFQTPPGHAGFFIKGQYIWNEKTLKHGLQNNKLCLFNRHQFIFPTISDLSAPGMGEIEGHYQPTLKPEYKNEPISTLRNPLTHDAGTNQQAWIERHERYAAWEHYMNTHNAWPTEDNKFRNTLKTLFRKSPCRPLIAFLHSYILKAGFLDGAAGYNFAQSRARYYQMIAEQKPK